MKGYFTHSYSFITGEKKITLTTSLFTQMRNIQINMEEAVTSPPEINRKRKNQTELVETPSSKHVCWGEEREYDPLSPIVCESDQESANGSNSFHGDTDVFMSPYDETKAEVEYPKTCASNEPCTAPSSSGTATPAGTDLHSLETRSLTMSNFSTSDSVSVSVQRDCPHHGYGPLNKDRILEFGSPADCCCSENSIDYLEYCTNKELEYFVQTNSSAASGDFILSSGRWPAHQDTQPHAPKLTIDREFEQYFSNLML